MNLKRKKHMPAVVLATRSEEALSQMPRDTFQIREAVSTMGVMSALNARPVLIVADPEELIESPEMSREALITALDSVGQDGVVVVDSKAFIEDRERWIGEALLSRGDGAALRYMPRRAVMLTNYCGGVGKSTLSLALARRFRETTGLPAAVVEVGVGGSSMSRLGELSTLFEVVTQDADPGEWHGVHLYPSDDWETKTLATDERTETTLSQIYRQHTLVTFDTFPTNALWRHALELVTDVIVVTSPRPDAIEQTGAMMRRLQDELETLAAQPEIHLVLNQVQSMGQRLPLAGELSAWVKYDEGAALSLEGDLSDPLLGLMYPGWSHRAKRKGASKGGVRRMWGKRKDKGGRLALGEVEGRCPVPEGDVEGMKVQG